MPQGVSVVSVGPYPGDHLLLWTKQPLSFMVLCRWEIFCKMVSAFLMGYHRQGRSLAGYQQLRAECRLSNLYHHIGVDALLFQWFVLFFSGSCIFSVWRRELLLETQCSQSPPGPLSREVGSDNPIFYNVIPFESSMCLDTQQKELFQLFSKTDNQHQKLRGGGRGLAHSPAGRSFLVNLLQLLL